MWEFNFEKTESLRCMRTGVYIKLKSSENRLLLLLLSNPHRTVTKEEILSAIWPGKVVSEASMISAVAKLRQALGDNAQEQKFVRTVPKVGYYIVSGEFYFTPENRVEENKAVTGTPSKSKLSLISFIGLLCANILLFFFLFIPPEHAEFTRFGSFKVGSNYFKVEESDLVSNQIMEAILRLERPSNVDFYITSNQSRVYVACAKNGDGISGNRSINFSVDIRRPKEFISHEVITKCQ